MDITKMYHFKLIRTHLSVWLMVAIVGPCLFFFSKCLLLAINKTGSRTMNLSWLISRATKVGIRTFKSYVNL